MYKELNDGPKLQPLWATINITVATLCANWIWGNWFSQAKGMAAFLLMLGCLMGWPVTVGLLSIVQGLVLKRCEDQPLWGMGLILGVLGAGFAAYGIPGPWNLLGCAVVATIIGVQARRAAQDDADLEDL
ncbi:hypothetical protein LJR129_004372 [Acidovorax sp. LjRoot129]|uniref:hypothetical protein n=1 Tax=Acidovorax sp. LjRoot129 TaxID=3342260 RepID=UPI003ED12921